MKDFNKYLIRNSRVPEVPEVTRGSLAARFREKDKSAKQVSGTQGTTVAACQSFLASKTRFSIVQYSIVHKLVTIKQMSTNVDINTIQ